MKFHRLRAAARAAGAYLDDLLFFAGLAAFSRAGFLWCRPAGWAVLGAGLMAYSILIARR